MNANSLPPLESHEEIFKMRTQPLPTPRFKTVSQRLLAYLLFYPVLSILALALVVFLLDFPIAVFGGLLKWIRYLWKQKTTEELRPWFRQPSLVALLTSTLGWIALGEMLPFQALGSIVAKGNLFSLACFVGIYIYLCVLVCLELQANEQREQQEKERIKTLKPKVLGWGLGLGAVLVCGGMLLAPKGFQFSLDISSLVGGAVGLLGGLMLVFALFFTEGLIGLYLRI